MTTARTIVIACPYCGTEHTAHDSGTSYGWNRYRVECPATTPYAVTEFSELRIDTCGTCLYRATYYSLGPCDAHNGDVWPTRKDN